MLNDKNIFKKFEQTICFMRWILVFITLFSLDNSIYSNLRLFESICGVLLLMGIWNVVVYILVQKIEGLYVYRHILGGIEIIVDLVFVASIAKVFGNYSNSSIYIFHVLISIIAYIRYIDLPIVWVMQALVVLDMWWINQSIYTHYYNLKNMTFEAALVVIGGLGFLFYYVIKEFERLRMLVDVQSNDVRGLKQNIIEMNSLSEMSQLLFESQSKESIMRNLLENIQKATSQEGISVFLYGENGVESDAKLYHFAATKKYYNSDVMPYEVVYNQKEVESLRERREYRFCIQNYEPIMSTNSKCKDLFKTLLGEDVKPFIYLFNMMNGDESIGMVMCNMSVRMTTETCRNIDRMVEHAGIALFKASQLEKERSKSIYDTLTGVKSRVSINETLPMMMKQVREDHASLGVLFIDIDNFKKFNDTYGHSVGDVVLREVARTLRQYSPGDSLVGRYGGEEFLVVFYDVDEQKAMEQAEYIRQKVSEIDLQKLLDINTQITISIGVALYPNHALGMDLLVEYADEAMYVAKKVKNKVSIYQKCKCKENEHEN
ncbi:MAG: GGDEF domain-containing protein [Cellulosilyticaceae bacterium]